MDSNENISIPEKRSSNFTKKIKNKLLSLQNKIASSQYSYLAFCFIVPALIMYLLYMAIEIHPFGDGTVLVLDLNGQYVYFHEGLRSAIYGDASFLYTFFRTLGGEFIGMYAYYLASPISYLVAIFPEDRMLEALLAIILIKVGICGLTFGFYLHKNSKNRNKISIVMFSVMYALCAYAVVYQSNIMWIDAMFWLPILTYSVEQLIKNRRYKLFVISLAMAIMSNYYIGYMVCIYVAVYYFYYVFSHNRDEINPHGIKYNRARSFLRIAFFSIVAIGISAFIILGAYYSLSFGKSTFTDTNWTLTAKFKFLDFFTKLLPGSYDTVRPTGLPYVYSGLLTVMLIPVYFMAEKIPARERVASLFLITFFILSFVASPLDLIWHGFQRPMWLNHRYSFIFTFILLTLAYKGLGNLKSAGKKFLLGITAAIILFVTVCDKLEFSTYVESDSHLLTLQTVWLTIVSSVVLFVLLCLLIRHKKPSIRKGLSGVVAVVVCIEIFCSSLTCMVQFDADVAYSTYSRYNNFLTNLRPIVNQVQAEDTGFYRMEKLTHRKYNDNMALRMRGLSGSTSTLNAEAIAFLKNMGYTARSHLSQYRGGTPVSDSLLGIKYLIDSEGSKNLTNSYELYATNNGFSAYYNPNAMSIAFGVDSSISDFELAKKGTIYFERLNSLVGTMLGAETSPDLFVPIEKSKITNSHAGGCKEEINGNAVTYTKLSNGKEGSFSYSFVAPESAEYYFYSPYKKAAESTISVLLYDEEEGKAVTKKSVGNYLGSDTNCIMSLGYYEAGEEITVKLTLKDNPLTLYTLYDYIWYLDADAFNTAFSELKNAPQFNITEYTEDDLKGSITTNNASQTIQTTIPYDEGWKVYVDGKEVETYKTLDALMAFDISEAGTHSLEFKYAPDIYFIGLAISIISLLFFVILCIIEVILRKIILRKKDLSIFELKGDAWVLEDYDKDEEEKLLGNDISFRKNSTIKERMLVILDEMREKLEESRANGTPEVDEDLVVDDDTDDDDLDDEDTVNAESVEKTDQTERSDTAEELDATEAGTENTTDGENSEDVNTINADVIEEVDQPEQSDPPKSLESNEEKPEITADGDTNEQNDAPDQQGDT